MACFNPSLCLFAFLFAAAEMTDPEPTISLSEATTFSDEEGASSEAWARRQCAFEECPFRPGAPNYRGARLQRHHDLTGFDLQEADFTGARGNHIIFNAANLTDACLYGAGFYDQSEFRRAIMVGVNGVGADLTNAEMQGADLTNSNFYGADLTGAKLDIYVDAQGNYHPSHLNGACFYGTDLAWANLGGADLRGADFRGADLCNANLAAVVVDGTTDFTGAHCAPRGWQAETVVGNLE